jgi:hypothetical protein
VFIPRVAPPCRAGAQAGPGDCLAASDPAEAVRLWSRARDIFAELEAPERHDLDGRLAAHPWLPLWPQGGRDQLRVGPNGGTMVR